MTAKKIRLKIERLLQFQNRVFLTDIFSRAEDTVETQINLYFYLNAKAD